MRTLRILALVASLAPMSAALAADLLVPSTQYPTIQSAINAAVSGDRVLVGPGVYNERLNLLGKGVTLKSQRGAYLTALDAQGTGGNLLSCIGGEPEGTSIDGFTFRFALNSAVRIHGSNLAILNCRFLTNLNGDEGAALAALYDSNVAISNTEFTGNQSNSVGGAIRLHGSNATIASCVFQGNRTLNQGGAIYADGWGRSRSLAISNTRFVGNIARPDHCCESWGGAVYLLGCDANITNCDFESNAARSAGGWVQYGGSMVINACAPHLTLCRFTDCSAGIDSTCFASNDARGGSIFCTGEAKPVFTNCDWLRSSTYSRGNCGERRSFGGAIYLTTRCNAEFTQCTFENCIALAQTDHGKWSRGGAIYMDWASPKIAECEFINCQAQTLSMNGGVADAYGGALWGQTYASPIVTDSLFSGCAAWRGGAAYFDNISAPVFVSCIFRNNNSIDAGGVLATWESPALVADSLFESNDSPNGSAAWFVGSRKPTFQQNFLCSNAGIDLVGDYTDAGGNVVVNNCAVDCDDNGFNDGWDIFAADLRSMEPGWVDPDCDNNGALDGCDLADHPERDCNHNDVLDVCEPGSSDCDDNGIDDSCEADCDNDGVADACEILAGAPDCDSDGIPDACQLAYRDANRDGILDACQTMQFTGLKTEIVPIAASDLPTGAVCYRVWATFTHPEARVFGFFGSPGKELIISAAGGFFQSTNGADLIDGVSCEATGADLFDSWFTIGRTCNSAFGTHPLYEAGMDFTLFNSGGSLQTSNGIIFVDPEAPQGVAGDSKRVLIMQLTTNQAVALVGKINLVGANADPLASEWEAYEVPIPAPTLIDCNLNGVHDALDIAAGTSSDCDRNGVPDECGDFQDCNENGRLDACDIADGSTSDANTNGVPDECECLGDVDGNGDVDVMDIVEILLSWGEPAPSPADVDGNGIVETGDLAIVLLAFGGC